MDKRREYVEKLSAQMVEWNTEMKRLQEKVAGAPAESKWDYYHTMAALQLKRDEAGVRLQGIAAARDDEWEELKTGTDEVWDDVRTVMYNAVMKMP